MNLGIAVKLFGLITLIFLLGSCIGDNRNPPIFPKSASNDVVEIIGSQREIFAFSDQTKIILMDIIKNKILDEYRFPDGSILTDHNIKQDDKLLLFLSSGSRVVIDFEEGKVDLDAGIQSSINHQYSARHRYVGTSANISPIFTNLNNVRKFGFNVTTGEYEFIFECQGSCVESWTDDQSLRSFIYETKDKNRTILSLAYKARVSKDWNFIPLASGRREYSVQQISDKQGAFRYWLKGNLLDNDLLLTITENDVEIQELAIDNPTSVPIVGMEGNGVNFVPKFRDDPRWANFENLFSLYEIERKDLYISSKEISWYEKFDRPSFSYIAKFSNGQLKFISSFDKDNIEIDLTEAFEDKISVHHKFMNLGGEVWPYWIYEPTNIESNGIIIYIHGGPFWHADPTTRSAFQPWIERGFTVFAPEYPGSIGYGHDHISNLRNNHKEIANRLNQFQKEIRKNNPNKTISILGDSFAGFLVSHLSQELKYYFIWLDAPLVNFCEFSKIAASRNIVWPADYFSDYIKKYCAGSQMKDVIGVGLQELYLKNDMFVYYGMYDKKISSASIQATFKANKANTKLRSTCSKIFASKSGHMVSYNIRERNKLITDFMNCIKLKDR